MLTSEGNGYTILYNKLSGDGNELVEELKTKYEEADTRIFLFMFHVFSAGFKTCVIHSPDTNIWFYRIWNT